MARIIFEAGDIVSFVGGTKDSNTQSSSEFLGVCMNESQCICFLYRDGNSYIESDEGEMINIPNEALPIVLERGVPAIWRQMFNALVVMAKAKE